MYFKTSLALLVGASIFLSSCRWQPLSSLSLGDKNPPASDLSIGGLTCMTEVGKKVSDYLNGDMTVSQLRQFTGCIRNALSNFKKFITPVSDNTYTAKQLADFLNLHFLSPTKITDAFRREIMSVKVVILGGSDQTVTRDEVDKIIALVSFVESEAIDNLPYLRAYNTATSHDADVDRTYLDQAATHLHKSTLALAEKLQINQKTYTLESLTQLVGEVQTFLNWRELHPSSMTPEAFVSLVSAHKHLVTGRKDENILPTDWALMFDSITSMFSAYTNYRAKLYEGPVTYGPNLDILVSTVHNVFDLIGRIIDRLPQKTIPFASTDQYIHALYEVKYMPESIREKSIVDVYHNVVAKALRSPLNQNQTEAVSGLSWRQLTELENEFNLWADSQLYLSDRAQKSLGFGSIPSEQVFQMFQSALKSFDLSELTKGVDLHDPRGREIEHIINEIPPYFRDNDSRAFIIPADAEERKKYDVKYGITNLTNMNVIRAMTRLLIRGFATDDRILKMNNNWLTSGVTEDELESFYELLRDFGEDLHFMDPMKLEAGRKFFVEGKIFAYDSDGLDLAAGKDDLLSFKLTMEYLATLWSGGQIRDVLYKEFHDKCPSAAKAEDEPIDDFGKPKVDRNCFVAHFFDNSLSEFSNLPLMQKSLAHLDPQRRRAMLSNLQSIAHIPCEDARYITLSEFATIATALHYVETIFAVYDKDRDNVLDQFEIMSAFERFNGYLSKQVTLLKKKVYPVKTLKSIFAFIISKQRIPTTYSDEFSVWSNDSYYDNYPDQFSHINYSQVPKLPTMSIDRIGILNVLRVLAAASPPHLRKECTEKPPEF